MSARRWIVTAGAGLVLADASIVTLALPELLRELGTTVEGVAAVIAVYTVALAVALLPAERLVRRHGAARVGAAGFALFGAASALCAAADALAPLLAARALQAVGGAAGLVAAFALIAGGTPAGRRHWLAAAVLAAAVGPALGGALTQAFDWRAIFLVQVPVAAAAGVAAARAPRPLGADGGVAASGPPAPAGDPVASGAAEAAGPPVPVDGGFAAAGPDAAPTAAAFAGPHVSRPIPVVSAVALALLSAALTAVLFLLVLLLVAGWALSPLAAAATVTVLPVAAVAGARVPGAARTRAAAGALLVGAGVLALAWLPAPDVWWTIAPQLLAGVGMGMALPAFAGELLPEATPRDAAWLLTIRHGGIALVLVAVAPLIADRLDAATERAQQRGVALVLDARLPPQDKLALAPALLGGVDAEQPRARLRAALRARRADYAGEERAVYDAIARRADETVVTAVGEAFRDAFALAGAAALLAALALLASRAGGATAAAGGPGETGRGGSGAAGRSGGGAGGRRVPAAALAAALLALAVPAAYAAAHARLAPAPVALRDPCADRELPGTGGLAGFLQDRALEAIDAGACRLGVGREELVLALADADAAQRFEERHGVDPRSVPDLLRGLLAP